MIERLISGINRRIQLQAVLQRSNDQLERRIAERTRELSEKNRLLEHLSQTDPLTSAANRRYFDDTLNREYKRLGRGATHLSLILCDVDYFKTFNDLFGHKAGDECLKQVVRQLHACVKRENDCVARYGGEEFAIILPDTPKQAAVELAERIRQTVETLGIPHEKPKGSSQVVTLSLGVACADGQDGEEGYDTALIVQADQALYRAKAKGRNRVESG
jgi:diguanylate cyclase (GGDEF)-like protein